jgi:general secretion pathway protein D/MSHA biogenesis protein MshL
MKVLSNPKVSVMNGQPAIIYVGENETYIDSVTTTVSGDSGTASTSVTTAQTTSGIRLEVYPTIISDDEIIMSLTPMVSGLTTDIEYISFGGGDNVVGVPVVKEQTMNTIIRVRNGELLVVGGLIDRKNEVDENKVRGLGDIPLIDRLFKSTAKRSDTTEIVILLQPRII